MTGIHDQELIGYVFADPDTDGGRRAITEISRTWAAYPGARVDTQRRDGAIVLSVALPAADGDRAALDELWKMTIGPHRGNITGEALTWADETLVRPDGDADRERTVFVVYGRDEKVRRAFFDFLRALGLRPLEWEELLKLNGDAASHLGEAVRAGLAGAAAAVVLMTPDDVVHLHPDLHKSRERPGEIADTLQPRPNVLIELGMALAVLNGRTILVKAGDQREITDMGGLSYVRLADTPECRVRIRERLEAAGCRVTASTDWLTAGDFGGLSALRRQP